MINIRTLFAAGDAALWYVAKLIGFARDWQVSFSVQGKAGETNRVAINPQCRFRGEKLIINEILPDETRPACDAQRPTATMIMSFAVGIKNQFSTTGGVSSAAFVPEALGNGMRFDTCHLGEELYIEVKFLRDCTVYGTLFGTAIIR